MPNPKDWTPDSLPEQMLERAEAAYRRECERENGATSERETIRLILEAALRGEPRVSADRGARNQDAEIEALERERDDLQTELSAKVSARDVKIQRLEAELADSRAPREGTPVAWVRGTDLAEWTTDKDRGQAWIEQGWKVTALYDHRPVSQHEPSAQEKA